MAPPTWAWTFDSPGTTSSGTPCPQGMPVLCWISRGKKKTNKKTPHCSLVMWRTAEYVMCGATDASAVPHTIWPCLSGRSLLCFPSCVTTRFHYLVPKFTRMLQHIQLWDASYCMFYFLQLVICNANTLLKVMVCITLLKVNFESIFKY